MMRTNLDSQVWRGRLKNAKEEAPRCLRQQRGAGELVGASVCVWCTRFDHIVHRSPSVKSLFRESVRWVFRIVRS
jgi:hypothetical protein